jgi:hypothetical protein
MMAARDTVIFDFEDLGLDTALFLKPEGIA